MYDSRWTRVDCPRCPALRGEVCLYRGKHTGRIHTSRQDKVARLIRIEEIEKLRARYAQEDSA